ncbi:transposase [Amycolatopsis thermophila]|uniref:transposase n=1 Tax=Amycolatopsis thermophila TaxID=206084 RepID=UPI003521E946
MARLCGYAWAEFVPFLAFDPEIRRVTCSTNAIDSVNARIGRAVKARGHLPTGTGWKRRTMRWKAVLVGILVVAPAVGGVLSVRHARRWCLRVGGGATSRCPGPRPAGGTSPAGGG